MVTRRWPATLGIRTLLAQGRRADLEELRSDRQDGRAAQSRHWRRRALRGGGGEKTRRRFRVHHAGVRGSLALAAERSRVAAQCRSERFQAVGSGRTFAHGAGVRPGAQRSQGIRSADPALERRCRQIFLALEERALEAAARQPVSDARRFPAGTAAADRLTAAYSRGTISLSLPTRSNGAP